MVIVSPPEDQSIGSTIHRLHVTIRNDEDMVERREPHTDVIKYTFVDAGTENDASRYAHELNSKHQGRKESPKARCIADTSPPSQTDELPFSVLARSRKGLFHSRTSKQARWSLTFQSAVLMERPGPGERYQLRMRLQRSASSLRHIVCFSSCSRSSALFILCLLITVLHRLANQLTGT